MLEITIFKIALKCPPNDNKQQGPELTHVHETKKSNFCCSTFSHSQRNYNFSFFFPFTTLSRELAVTIPQCYFLGLILLTWPKEVLFIPHFPSVNRYMEVKIYLKAQLQVYLEHFQPNYGITNDIVSKDFEPVVRVKQGKSSNGASPLVISLAVAVLDQSSITYCIFIHVAFAIYNKRLCYQ